MWQHKKTTALNKTNHATKEARIDMKQMIIFLRDYSRVQEIISFWNVGIKSQSEGFFK